MGDVGVGVIKLDGDYLCSCSRSSVGTDSV